MRREVYRVAGEKEGRGEEGMGRGMERRTVEGLNKMNEEREGGRVERDEGRKGKEERNDRGRKGRLKSVCCCHYNHSLISHEGLYSVIISCYSNKIFSFFW